MGPGLRQSLVGYTRQRLEASPAASPSEFLSLEAQGFLSASEALSVLFLRQHRLERSC
jgi:hypothetical protein